MRWLDSIIDSIDMNLRKLGELVKDRGARSAAAHGAAKSLIRLSDRTATATSEDSGFQAPPPRTLEALEGVMQKARGPRCRERIVPSARHLLHSRRQLRWSARRGEGALFPTWTELCLHQPWLQQP